MAADSGRGKVFQRRILQTTYRDFELFSFVPSPLPPSTSPLLPCPVAVQLHLVVYLNCFPQKRPVEIKKKRVFRSFIDVNSAVFSAFFAVAAAAVASDGTSLLEKQRGSSGADLLLVLREEFLPFFVFLSTFILRTRGLRHFTSG